VPFYIKDEGQLWSPRRAQRYCLKCSILLAVTFQSGNLRVIGEIRQYGKQSNGGPFFSAEYSRLHIRSILVAGATNR
jgi:hypothetical protein